LGDPKVGTPANGLTTWLTLRTLSLAVTVAGEEVGPATDGEGDAVGVGRTDDDDDAEAVVVVAFGVAGAGEADGDEPDNDAKVDDENVALAGRAVDDSKEKEDVEDAGFAVLDDEKEVEGPDERPKAAGLNVAVCFVALDGVNEKADGLVPGGVALLVDADNGDAASASLDSDANEAADELVAKDEEPKDEPVFAGASDEAALSDAGFAADANDGGGEPKVKVADLPDGVAGAVVDVESSGFSSFLTSAADAAFAVPANDGGGEPNVKVLLALVAVEASFSLPAGTDEAGEANAGGGEPNEKEELLLGGVAGALVSEEVPFGASSSLLFDTSAFDKAKGIGFAPAPFDAKAGGGEPNVNVLPPLPRGDVNDESLGAKEKEEVVALAGSAGAVDAGGCGVLSDFALPPGGAPNSEACAASFGSSSTLGADAAGAAAFALPPGGAPNSEACAASFGSSSTLGADAAGAAAFALPPGGAPNSEACAASFGSSSTLGADAAGAAAFALPPGGAPKMDACAASFGLSSTVGAAVADAFAFPPGGAPNAVA